MYIRKEDFRKGFDKASLRLDKAMKKEAYNIIHNLIADFEYDNDINYIELGSHLARLESFFHPSATNKKDPIQWCLQALSKGKHESRGYVKLGKYIKGVGFVCTDGVRVFCYTGKIVKTEDNYYHPKKQDWITDEQAEDLKCTCYPDVGRVLNIIPEAVKASKEDFTTFDKEDVCIDYSLNLEEFKSVKKSLAYPVASPSEYRRQLIATIPEEYPEEGFNVKIMYNKQYFNQAVAGMVNPVFHLTLNTSLIITSDNDRKVAIMRKVV